jgi:hypothetical protein
VSDLSSAGTSGNPPDLWVASGLQNHVFDLEPVGPTGSNLDFDLFAEESIEYGCLALECNHTLSTIACDCAGTLSTLFCHGCVV